ncbi:MAG: hypothetical protein P1U39_00415 [Legionellaceae bacterium]|nr:hypothetical protein [Legionellaceae bacterium]
MMSVRHFTQKNKQASTLFSPREEHSSGSRLDFVSQPMLHTHIPDLSSLKIDVEPHLLLTPLPVIDYAQNMENVRTAFQDSIQSPMDTSTRHKLIEVMQSSLIACFKFMPLNQAVEEAQTTLDFIQLFPPDRLITYPWIAELPCAHPFAVVIACELSMSFNHAVWPYFHVLFKNNKPQCNEILQNLLVSTLYFASAHLDLAFTYIELLDSDTTDSCVAPRMSEDDIKFSIQKAENCVQEFHQHVLYCNFQEQRVFFELDHVLFLAFIFQAKLSLKQNKFEEVSELINQAGVFIQRYRRTTQFKMHRHAPNAPVLFRELKHALKIKKNHAQRTAEETTEETCDSPPSSPIPIEACTQNESEKNVSAEQITLKAAPEEESQNLIGRKRLKIILKKRKHETQVITHLPTCYEANPRLRGLLDLYSDVFIACGLDGYLFGSGNYKQHPGDFDILIPNINTKPGQERLMHLIQMIESQGGVALRDSVTGELGYKKSNRYVIPITWHDWKTDFIIEAEDFIEHAKRLDYTVGALYFSLRTKKTYCMKGFSSVTDLEDKILRTIDDPYVSFKRDPSLIFRGIRLCALENFRFSPECLAAIHTIFVKEKNNLFTALNPGKLCQQLNLMFTTPEEVIILDKFKELNLLPKLSQCIHALPDRINSQNSYIISLMQYKSSPKHRVSTLGMYSTTACEAKDLKTPSQSSVTTQALP